MELRKGIVAGLVAGLVMGVSLFIVGAFAALAVVAIIISARAVWSC